MFELCKETLRVELGSLDEASGTEVNSTGDKSSSLIMNILLTCDRELIHVLLVFKC